MIKKAKHLLNTILIVLSSSIFFFIAYIGYEKLNLNLSEYAQVINTKKYNDSEFILICTGLIFGIGILFIAYKYYRQKGIFKTHDMDIAEKYVDGLMDAYYDYNGGEWIHFEKVKHSASERDIKRLREVYPDVPEALINLLKYVDGTYWREYNGEKIAFYFLGSDVEEFEYPYYLLSSVDIVKNRGIAIRYYSDYIERKYDTDEVKMDDKITDKLYKVKWLHFSNCMNNGGTSQLFIDFSPSEKGKKGQIIRFLHDPDEFAVIADSFEDYLNMLIDNEYAFINEDTVEEDEWN